VERFSNEEAKSVMITESVEKGGFYNNTLRINKSYFEGYSFWDINEWINKKYDPKCWQSKDIKDLVNHEIAHARLTYSNSNSKVNSIYEFLSDENTSGICKLVDKDSGEFLSEVCVMIDRGENLPENQMKIYYRYMEGN